MKTKRIYIDVPFNRSISSDDFIVCVGSKKTNSVYHVVEVVRVIPHKKRGRVNRHYLDVINTDLITALRRDKNTQKLFTLTWYKRKKKK